MPVVFVGPTPEQMGKDISSWIRQATIDVAEDALRTEWAAGFDRDPVVITDGVPRRDWLQVKPFGKIEFAARPNMAEAVLWALAELRRRSPVLTGRYRDAHFVMINGSEIAGDVLAALRNIKETDRVQIVNPQIYARKIEGATASKRSGRVKRRALSRQARNGVYRVVQSGLVSRYGRTMFFDFKYVQLNTGVKVWGRQGGGHKRGGKYVGGGNRKRVQRSQVYPAIQFFIKPTALPN
ncbi:MAG: hypothetical protein NTV97_31320 [Alphaproteobacteria bacterium]|nr:hypothetical protein [Alphaproteobacteria bacterium]